MYIRSLLQNLVLISLIDKNSKGNRSSCVYVHVIEFAYVRLSSEFCCKFTTMQLYFAPFTYAHACGGLFSEFELAYPKCQKLSIIKISPRIKHMICAINIDEGKPCVLKVS